LSFQVNRGQAAIAQRGGEQTAAGQIDRHVIDSAAYITKWDFRLQL